MESPIALYNAFVFKHHFCRAAVANSKAAAARRAHEMALLMETLEPTSLGGTATESELSSRVHSGSMESPWPDQQSSSGKDGVEDPGHYES